MKEIKTLIQLDQNLKDKLEYIKQKIVNNEDLKAYLNANNIRLDEIKLNNSLMNLLHYVENVHKCDNCIGLDSCTQFNQGFKPILEDNDTFIHIKYLPCEFYKAYEVREKISEHLKSFYMPKKILKASLDEVEIEKERMVAINRIATFAKSYTKDKFQKGVYLTGPFGVGKTYLLAAMANALAKRYIRVALVYFPDLIRELKSAIGKDIFEKMLMEIKTIDVLVLDDIGSEMNTQWVRDEILGPILQFRMLEELPTFFSSNKSINELIRDYAITNDNVQDDTKAQRIKDRIMALADEVKMSGKNYRN
ncbi:MAG TPA: primosomal protein DnaI [Haloplasmataceae bacterium]